MEVRSTCVGKTGASIDKCDKTLQGEKLLDLQVTIDLPMQSQLNQIRISRIVNLQSSTSGCFCFWCEINGIQKDTRKNQRLLSTSHVGL